MDRDEANFRADESEAKMREARRCLRDAQQIAPWLFKDRPGGDDDE